MPSGRSKKRKISAIPWFSLLDSYLALYKRLINSLVVFRHKYLFLLSCGSGYIFKNSQRQLFVKVYFFYLTLVIYIFTCIYFFGLKC